MDLDPKTLEVVRRPSRLQALASLRANAESSAEGLDRITRIACRALGVPVALVNLIDADRQQFMGCGSLPEPWKSMGEMPLTAGWCPFALDADAFAFADARSEPSLAGNAAAQSLGVVAYAGVPLRTADGDAVGTLCAVDYEPHEWTDDELSLMTDLAASAVAELQLLGASRVAAREHARLHALESVSCTIAGATTAGEVLDAVAGAGAEALARSGSPAPARVARAGEPTFLASRREVRDAFELDDVPDVGSVALLPVTAGGHALGVLGTCFPDERTFAEDDREYLAALAGISGLALARA
jgi:GAF domain-containing protein